MCKFFLMLSIGCFYIYNAFAGDVPTIVYGEADRADGGKNVFVVEQPQDAPNPLGNPLPNQDKPVEVFGNVYSPNTNKVVNYNSDQNYNTEVDQNKAQTLKNLGDDFENTLLEANGRVYDIQSYPKADFKAMENPATPATIYSPNVNN